MAAKYGLFCFLSVLLVGVVIISADDENPDVCQQRVKPGMCMGYFPRWYFDNKLNKCKKFIFGGCNGNGNNFESIRECERTCLHANDEELQSSHDKGEKQERSSTTHSDDDREFSSSAEEQKHQEGPCLHKVKKMAHKADLLKSILVHGAPMFQPKYVPQCDEEGYYAPMQCMMDKSKCWCVDRLGNKIKNSRERQTRGKPEELDCS